MSNLSRRPNWSSRQFGTPRGEGLLMLEFPEGDALALRIEIGAWSSCQIRRQAPQQEGGGRPS